MHSQDCLDTKQPVEGNSVECAAEAGGPSSPDTHHRLDDLAEMSPAEYGQRREALAKELGTSRQFLDLEWRERRKRTKVEDDDTFLPDPDPWPEPVNGAELLEQLSNTVASHLVLRKGAPDAIAMWALFTHAHDCFDISPVLGLTSPTPECGKTTLLTFLGEVVPRPLPASNITAAALFRAVAKWRPTLLIDEADTFLRGSDELRGILNSGHKRSNAFVIRTSGEDHEPKSFPTWAPKAVALIGKLPPTLASRAIHIALRRKTAVETVTPLRLDRLEHLELLLRKAARWTADNASALRNADPQMPATLHGRTADNWRPLLAVADVAGRDWHERARRSAEKLTAEPSGETSGIMVLDDIRQEFAARETDQITSADLVGKLTAMEHRPWPEWKNDKPLTPRQLARLLEPFDIAPTDIWTGEKCLKGYKLSQFQDAFTRYPAGTTRENARTGGS